MRNTRKTIAAHMESRTTPPTGCALGTPPEDPTRSFAAGPRASAPFALVTPSHDHSHRSPRWVIGAMFFQLLVGIYGGYFGAGISIMMLSTLSILGMTDILQMNALTSMFSLCINGVAAALFISAKMVYWPYVLAMAIAAIIGGYGAAGVARRVGRTAVRRFVIVVGFSISILLLIKRL